MNFFLFINSQLSFAAQISLISFFGLIFGSFASLISHRLATKQPIAWARSECPKCHAKLKPQNLIPLFSWLIQGGKCSNCDEKISIRYPAIELTFAISFLIIFFSFDQIIDERLVLICLITFVLITMAITDLEHYFIPDSLQYLLAIFVIILRIYDGGTYGAADHIKSAFLYTGFGLAMLAFFYVTTKIEAIGIDDIKFFFIAGLLLGIDNFLLFMLISGILGSLFGGAWQRLKDDQTFPFAPPLCAAFYVCMLFDNKINPMEILGKVLF